MAENGVYRIRFGFSNKINHVLPSQRVVDTVRNFDIRANLSHSEDSFLMARRPPDLWLLGASGGPGLVRGQCNVSFEMYPSTTHMWQAFASAIAFRFRKGSRVGRD